MFALERVFVFVFVCVSVTQMHNYFHTSGRPHEKLQDVYQKYSASIELGTLLSTTQI